MGQNWQKEVCIANVEFKVKTIQLVVVFKIKMKSKIGIVRADYGNKWK